LAVIIPPAIHSLQLACTVEHDRQFSHDVHPLTAKDLFETLAASWLMRENVFLANVSFAMA